MKKVTAVPLKRSNLLWSPEISLLVVTNPEQVSPPLQRAEVNVAAMVAVARVAVVADSAAVAEVVAAVAAPVAVVADLVVPVAAAGVDAVAAEVMAAVAVVAAMVAVVAAVAMTCLAKAIHKAEDINDLRRCEGTACAPLFNTVGRN
jgi:hypothetical protein